jgi:type II secretory pathway pseudopilin PulG
MPWLKTISTRVRRGLSLVELLVAIGVVLAIAAIVIPWTAGWLGGRELDNAEDNLTMQMMMARAAAREEGRPVEVVAEYDGVTSRVQARWMAAGEDSDGAFARSGPRDEAAADSKLGASIDATWASVKLPHGVCVALGISDAKPGADAKRNSDEAEQADAKGQTLAIFLPDGTVFFAPVFMLRTDAGSLRAMKVDRATGVPQAVEHAVLPEDGDASERPEFDGIELDEPVTP